MNISVSNSDTECLFGFFFFSNTQVACILKNAASKQSLLQVQSILNGFGNFHPPSILVWLESLPLDLHYTTNYSQWFGLSLKMEVLKKRNALSL